MTLLRIIGLAGLLIAPGAAARSADWMEDQEKTPVSAPAADSKPADQKVEKKSEPKGKKPARRRARGGAAQKKKGKASKSKKKRVWVE